MPCGLAMFPFAAWNAEGYMLQESQSSKFFMQNFNQQLDLWPTLVSYSYHWAISFAKYPAMYGLFCGMILSTCWHLMHSSCDLIVSLHHQTRFKRDCEFSALVDTWCTLWPDCHGPSPHKIGIQVVTQIHSIQVPVFPVCDPLDCVSGNSGPSITLHHICI